MFKFRVTINDLKKVGKQEFWEKFKRLIVAMCFIVVLSIYFLIVGLVADSKYLLCAYPTLVICSLLIVGLVIFYVKILSTYKRYSECAYQITYNKETVNITNELTNNSVTFKISELRLRSTLKSYLLFIVPGEVERLFIVPRNVETKDFEKLFILKSTD